MQEDTDVSLKFIERLLELYPPPADARDDISMIVKLAASVSIWPELRAAIEQRLAANPDDWLANEVLRLVELQPWVPLPEMQARYGAPVTGPVTSKVIIATQNNSNAAAMAPANHRCRHHLRSMPVRVA